MQSKKIVCFFSVLLLLSALMYIGDASSSVTVSFRGGGVTIDLTYPEEAHPNATITHNVTITAHTDLSLQSFTLFIYAPVNETLQEVKNRTISWDFLENETLTSRIEFQLPQDTNGTLYCEMTVKTDQTTDTSSYKFYTTRVSELTLSEMQTLYYEMLANYTSLQGDYQTLLNGYNGLLANYSNLFTNYTTLLSEYEQLLADHDTLLDDYDELSANYSSLYATYTTLLSQHNQLTADYNSQVSKYNNLLESYDNLDENYRVKGTELDNLQTDYDDLNSTRYNLQIDYEALQAGFITLNQTYYNLQTAFADLQRRFTDSEGAVNVDRVVMFIFLVTVAVLIAFIVYLKRKKEDPYLVIRKETVSMKSDEEK